MHILMVGVDEKRIGGMWTVAESFIDNLEFNKKVNLYYVATSTSGSIVNRILKMLTGYVKIFMILLTCKIDIVHIHMAERGSVYRKGLVVYISKLFKKKVVVQMHAGAIMAWYNTLSDFKKKIVFKIFNKADEFFVLGNYWKEQLLHLVSCEKIRILYNGAKCPNINLYNINGNSILYLGVIKRSKGVYDLVDAIKLIDNNLPKKLKIYICGIDEDGNLESYINELKLQNRIILTGWIDKQQRLELFNNTMLCVLPSYFEALSMTVIESMCYGIPIVTTNISTMPELLGDEIHLVEPGDVRGLSKEIFRLVNCVNERKKYSHIEYNRAKHFFNIDVVIKKTLIFYEDLLYGNKIKL